MRKKITIEYIRNKQEELEELLNNRVCIRDKIYKINTDAYKRLIDLNLKDGKNIILCLNDNEKNNYYGDISEKVFCLKIDNDVLENEVIICEIFYFNAYNHSIFSKYARLNFNKLNFKLKFLTEKEFDDIVNDFMCYKNTIGNILSINKLKQYSAVYTSEEISNKIGLSETLTTINKKIDDARNIISKHKHLIELDDADKKIELNFSSEDDVYVNKDISIDSNINCGLEFYYKKGFYIIKIELFTNDYDQYINSVVICENKNSITIMGKESYKIDTEAMVKIINIFKERYIKYNPQII